MISFDKIAEIENKDFDKLSEQELLIYNYWNIYKEANLYYKLMTSCIEKNLSDLGFMYAKKGKVAATMAMTLYSKVKLNMAQDKYDDFTAMFKEDEVVITNNIQGTTKTVEIFENTGTFGNVLELIAKPTIIKQELDPKKIEQLKNELLKIKLDNDIAKANASLKILDKLLLTGQISANTYNKKCIEIMRNKPKSA